MNGIYTNPYTPQIYRRPLNQRGNQQAISSEEERKSSLTKEAQQEQVKEQQTSKQPAQLAEQQKYQNQHQIQQQVQQQAYYGQNQINYQNKQKNNQQQQGGSQTPYMATKLNISQVLIDFNSTLLAIDPSEEVKKEVETYLNLVDIQSQKEVPAKKQITTNLKVAAEVLDNYITETLKKESNVVREWVNALLLQSIDFKADKSIKKGAFEAITGEAPQTEKLAKNRKKEAAENLQQLGEDIDNGVKKSKFASAVKESPEELIEKGLEKAERLIAKGDLDQALALYSKLFEYANKKGDEFTKATIMLKQAQIHNKKNNIPKCLECLDDTTKLAEKSANYETLADARVQMGEIYDEFGYFDAAMQNYYEGLSINGELNNTKSQIHTLHNIGNMYQSKYKGKEALDHYKIGFDMAKDEADIDAMGSILGNTASVFKNEGKPQTALKYYKDSAKLDAKAGKTEDLAITYEQSAEIMLELNKPKKALDLLNKSYKKAVKTNNVELIERIRNKIDDLDFGFLM